MKTHDSGHIGSPEGLPPEIPRKKRGVVRRIFLILGISLASLVVLIVAALIGVTYYLSPQRLTEIVNRNASEYFDADVKASNVRFTLWSTFPRLFIEMDSVKVVSRTLRGLPESIDAQLPENADFLASSGKIRGGVNVVNLLAGRIRLHDVSVSRLRLNLVSVNDSVANYMILPRDFKGLPHIPRISANRIVLDHPGKVTVFSLASGLRGSMALNSMSLKELGDDDRYNLESSGLITADVGDLQLLDRFPIKLDGLVALKYNPFALSLSDYSISLGNVRSKTTMDLDLGKKAGINKLNVNVETFSLIRLLHYLPAEALPQLSRLHGDLAVNATARLTRPYHFSSSALPSLEVDFAVDEGDISYDFKDGKDYGLHNSDMLARFVFDGENPEGSYIDLAPFTLTADGVNLAVGGKATDLTGTPHVTAKVKGLANLTKVAQRIPLLRPYKPSGSVKLSSTLDFVISDAKNFSVEDLIAKGEVNVDKVALRLPSEGLSIKSGKGLVKFDVVVPDMAEASGGFPLKTSGKLSGLALYSAADSLNMDVGTLKFNGKTKVAPNGGGHPAGVTLAADAVDIRLRHPGIAMDMKDLNVKLDGGSANGRHFARYGAPKSHGDAASLSRFRHTPEYLSVALSPSTKKLINTIQAHGSVHSSQAHLKIRNCPAPFDFGDCLINYSLDSLAIHHFNFRSQTSSMLFSGIVRNLREFMTADYPASLIADLNVNIDTLNFNQIGRAYEQAMIAAHGKESVDYTKIKPVASDSVAMLIPRNLVADIDLSARETIWTNMNFYDLDARINVADGVGDMPRLHLRTDFGEASMNAVYNTENINAMGLSADMNINDVNVVKFLQKFPHVLARVPYMKNFSGLLYVNGKVSAGIFPDMAFDMSSMEADLGLQGRNMQIRQNPFIHRIASMMLILGHEDIKIQNMDARAVVHDNLLELYPFIFEFDKYRLKLQGLNNFAGDLDYHIGVLHSPVPFPFGINITGQFHDPRLSFGGSGWNIKKSQEITSNVMKSFTFNLMKEMRFVFGDFMHHAAISPQNQ